LCAAITNAATAFTSVGYCVAGLELGAALRTIRSSRYTFTGVARLASRTLLYLSEYDVTAIRTNAALDSTAGWSAFVSTRTNWSAINDDATLRYNTRFSSLAYLTHAAASVTAPTAGARGNTWCRCRARWKGFAFKRAFITSLSTRAFTTINGSAATIRYYAATVYRRELAIDVFQSEEACQQSRGAAFIRGTCIGG
jgi:hypothetical protein